ncbi:Psd3 [Phodopus roborovskii]|uniref:Psd3 protein n=1 Tax=Phodopus roborovskii TaxID=109678 RepID=A0AAU9Z4K2_PHORO|nr:Psd3 [Phodopus roborovskii]
MLHINIYYFTNGDHGGSTLLPPTVTNEFPEYGTMEEGEGLRASLDLDAKSQPCCPLEQQAVYLLAGQDSMLSSVTEGPNDASQCHPQEQSLQPIDSLISALKATEARIVSGTFQATKVLDKDANFSGQPVDKEWSPASHKPQRTHRTFPASRKSSDLPLSGEVPTDGNFSLNIQEDRTALLPEEAQAELSLITNYRRQGPLCVQESACPVLSLRTSTGSHNPVDRAGVLKDHRSDLGREHPRVCDSGGFMGRQGRIKHVEFQGVEILWTGEKVDTQHPVGVETLPERTTSPVSKWFAKGSSHYSSAAGLCSNSVNLTGSVWDETWKVPSAKPGTSLGALPPVPLGESGEDEVFLRESKEHLEETLDLQEDKERFLEQEEHLRGGDDDILGPGYTEDSTDVYSSQFETILDNTSLYYSAESLETLYSEPDSYFSFEMPLTPMIQQRIREGGQFLERTSVGGHQDVLSVSADGGIVMDGVHCLTCAMMLLNTDLHGHVSVASLCLCVHMYFSQPLLDFFSRHDFLRNAKSSLSSCFQGEGLTWRFTCFSSASSVLIVNPFLCISTWSPYRGVWQVSGLPFPAIMASTRLTLQNSSLIVKGVGIKDMHHHPQPSKVIYVRYPLLSCWPVLSKRLVWKFTEYSALPPIVHLKRWTPEGSIIQFMLPCRERNKTKTNLRYTKTEEMALYLRTLVILTENLRSKSQHLYGSLQPAASLH